MCYNIYSSEFPVIVESVERLLLLFTIWSIWVLIFAIRYYKQTYIDLQKIS